MSPRRSFSANSLLFALIGAAFVVRALVPAGWMPAHAAGGFAIELCGPSRVSEGEQLRLARAMFEGAFAEQEPEETDGAGDQPCAFAGLPHAAPPPGAAPAVSPALPAAELQPRAPTAAIGQGLPAPPPPATGPPLNA